MFLCSTPAVPCADFTLRPVGKNGDERRATATGKCTTGPGMTERAVRESEIRA